MTHDNETAVAGQVDCRVRPHAILLERLRACSIDPMWANHAEVPKNLCAAAALEIERLRAALELAEPALELGCDALRSEAERYHAEMAGYRTHRHQEADDAYKQADIAWQAAVAALGPNA